MSALEVVPRITYRAPTKGRVYLTARSAAKAEADAMLTAKYPTEKPEYDAAGGMCYDPGYHWSSNERLMRVHARLAKRLLRNLRQTNRAAQGARS